MPNGFETFNLGTVLGQAEQIRGARTQTAARQQAIQRQNALAEREAQFNPLFRQFLAGETDIGALAAVDPARAAEAQEFVAQRNELARQEEQREADETLRSILFVEKSANPGKTVRTLFPQFVESLEGQGVDTEALTDEQWRAMGQGIKEQLGPRSSLSVEDLFGKAPAGFRRTPAGDLEFIPGGPQDPDTLAQQAQAKQVEKVTDDKTFERTNKLVTEARKDKRVDDHIEVTGALQRVEAAGATPAGDVSLIFAFMRALDPASTVREGEFATAQNTAGIPGRVKAQYNRAIEGTRLTPEQRDDFKGQVRNLVVRTEAQARAALEGIRPRAEAFNLDFSLIEQSIFPPSPAGELSDEELLRRLQQ